MHKIKIESLKMAKKAKSVKKSVKATGIKNRSRSLLAKPVNKKIVGLLFVLIIGGIGGYVYLRQSSAATLTFGRNYSNMSYNRASKKTVPHAGFNYQGVQHRVVTHNFAPPHTLISKRDAQNSKQICATFSARGMGRGVPKGYIRIKHITPRGGFNVGQKRVNGSVNPKLKGNTNKVCVNVLARNKHDGTVEVDYIPDNKKALVLNHIGVHTIYGVR